jgi:hypothetical protein
MYTPSSLKKTLSESYVLHAVHVKSVKNDLKPMDSLKCNFYFETEGVLWNINVGDYFILLLMSYNLFFYSVGQQSS